MDIWESEPSRNARLTDMSVLPTHEPMVLGYNLGELKKMIAFYNLLHDPNETSVVVHVRRILSGLAHGQRVDIEYAEEVLKKLDELNEKQTPKS